MVSIKKENWMGGAESSPLLKEVIAAAEKLPPFPEVVSKVMPLIQKMAPLSQIEAVIKYDQAIAAKILAASQSPLYARKHSGASLKEAITALGEQQLLAVIMTACSSRYFTADTTGYDLREGELWEHAVASALMSEIVCRHLGREDTFTAYTAGLLHDIGKTVLHHFVKTSFDTILCLVQEKKMRFLEAERQVLGIDHQQLGVLIARRWALPAEVLVAIRYHHNPLKAKEHQGLAALIYVANRMVSALGIGCGVDGLMQPNEDEVFVKLGITSRMVEKFLMELLVAFREAKEFLAA